MQQRSLRLPELVGESGYFGERARALLDRGSASKRRARTTNRRFNRGWSRRDLLFRELALLGSVLAHGRRRAALQRSDAGGA
jgi:hypothetical protein